MTDTAKSSDGPPEAETPLPVQVSIEELVSDPEGIAREASAGLVQIHVRDSEPLAMLPFGTLLGIIEAFGKVTGEAASVMEPVLARLAKTVDPAVARLGDALDHPMAKRLAEIADPAVLRAAEVLNPAAVRLLETLDPAILRLVAALNPTTVQLASILAELDDSDLERLRARAMVVEGAGSQSAASRPEALPIEALTDREVELMSNHREPGEPDESLDDEPLVWHG